MTAPLVTNTEPLNSAVDVNVRQPIQFVFDQALDVASVNQATIVLYETLTAERLTGEISLSADFKTITFLPTRALQEDITYKAVAIGIDLDLPGGYITSSGDALAVSYTVKFRTGEEQYVVLEEVTDLHDIDFAGPVRVAESQASLSLLDVELAITAVTPLGFQSQLPVNTSEISVVFGTGINPALLDSTAFQIEQVPSLGLDDYLAAPDTGRTDDAETPVDDRLVLWPCYTGVPTDLFQEPTGTIALGASNEVVWTRDPSVNFNYNMEIQITIDKTKVVGIDGSTLPDDITFVFTTTYFPLFVSATIIRVELGKAVTEMYDDTINRIIHKNSLDAWEQAGYCFSIYEPYPAVKRYVRAKTIIDIFDLLEVKDQLREGERKQLGDLLIEYGIGRGKAPRIYGRAVDLAAKSLRELRKYRGMNRPKAVIRGINSYEYRGEHFNRTWDSIKNSNSLFYRAELAGLPGANFRMHRYDKIGASYDHQGNMNYTQATTVFANGTLFSCPT